MYVQTDSIPIQKNRKIQYQNIWITDLEDRVIVFSMTLDLLVLLLLFSLLPPCICLTSSTINTVRSKKVSITRCSHFQWVQTTELFDDYDLVLIKLYNSRYFIGVIMDMLIYVMEKNDICLNTV